MFVYEVPSSGPATLYLPAGSSSRWVRVGFGSHHGARTEIRKDQEGMRAVFMVTIYKQPQHRRKEDRDHLDDTLTANLSGKNFVFFLWIKTLNDVVLKGPELKPVYEFNSSYYQHIVL